MPVEPIEHGVGSVHYGKQAAAGTITPVADAGLVRLRHRAGKLKPAKTYGQEEYSDGEAFASPSMFVSAVGGEVGALTFQPQPETGGLMLAQIAGVDTVTGSADPWTHTVTSAAANGPYGTHYVSEGSAVGPVRQAFWDSKITKATWQAGRDQEVAHMEITPLALRAGRHLSAVPTVADSGSDPYLWAEADTKVTIDTVAFSEVDGETIEIDRKLQAVRGQSVKPIAISPSKGSITRAFTAPLTNNVLPVIYSLLYGTTTPSAGDEPTGAVFYAALESEYVRSASRSLKITTPRVAVDPAEMEFGPDPEAGVHKVTFGGPCLKNGATAALTIVAKTGSSTPFV